MKNKELFDLLQGLRNVGTYGGVKFAYAVAKNMAKVLEECKLLEESAKPSDEHQAYDTERMALIDICAVKENGQCVIKNGQYVIDPAFKAQFNKESDDLQTKHATAINARKVQLVEFDKLLAEEASDLKLMKIKYEVLPESITAEHISGIMPIIED